MYLLSILKDKNEFLTKRYNISNIIDYEKFSIFDLQKTALIEDQHFIFLFLFTEVRS